ncbi:MAG: DUF5011 domain-containing protein [Bacilli bacterium]|nr:DUF5011 domain-containing protein [Bacilli bacterium]
MSDYSKAKIIGFIVILLILSLLIFVTFKIVNNNRLKQKEEASYLKYKDEVIEASLNGSYLEYITLGDEYAEDGIESFYNKKDISDDVIISYHKNGEQVSFLDTSKIGEYLVKYTIITPSSKRTIYKTVVVLDDKAPIISFPKKTIISLDEVSSYDLKKDVNVRDNSGDVDFSFDNTLEKKAGKYIITYKAKDSSGNVTEKRRVIEVK